MKRMKRAAACILAAVFVCSCLPLLVFSQRDENVKERTAQTPESLLTMLDFTASGDKAPKVISASVLALDHAGVTLTDGERAYFDENGIALKYSDVIPASYLTCERTAGGVNVTARVYSFSTPSGNTVSYRPVSASLGGATAYFEGAQTLSFLGLEDGHSYEARVEYETEITLSADKTDALFNNGYRAGADMLDAQAAYEIACDEYQRKSDEYAEIYAQYVSENSAYEAYRASYEDYTAKMQAYEAYVAAKAAYEEELTRYQAYLSEKDTYDERAQAYAVAYNKYLEDNRVYLESVAQLEACRRALEAFKMVFFLDEENHMMYNTIKGDTVKTVLNNRTRLIEEAGANKNDIDNAGKATDALDALLTPYRKLTKERDKFNYYAEHYEELKDNFTLLFTSLRSLGRNKTVEAVLSNRDRWDRYCQFVAHLYVLTCTLDDTVILDTGWTMKDKTLYDLLPDALIIEDKHCSDPAGLVYPDDKNLVEPTAPVAPTPPEAVKEPVKTWTVELTRPEKPEEVAKPDEPVDKTEYTGPKPVRPAPSDAERALMEEVTGGALTLRETQPLSLKLTAVATRQVTYDGMATVRFYDYDRRTLLYSETVFKNDPQTVSYKGETPARAADERNTYTFAGFVDEDGKAAALSYLKGDVDLFASYNETPVDYTVVFITHTDRETVVCHYGDLPTPTLSEESYYDGETEYRFAGYAPQIARVTGNAEYTAVYDRVDPQRFMITFDDAGRKTAAVYKKGETPEAPETIGSYTDEEYRYVFERWDPEISAAEGDTVYTALYAREPLVPLTDGGEGVVRVVSGQALTAIVPDEKSVMDVRYLLKRAAEEGKALSFVLSGMTVTFDEEALGKIADAVSFSAYAHDEDMVFTLTDADGADLFAGGGVGMTLTFSGSVRDEFRVEYIPQNGSDTSTVPFTVENGSVRVTLPRGGRYGIYLPHTVTVSGEAIPSVGTAYKGDTVTIRPLAGPDAVIYSLTLISDTGEEQTLMFADSFVMPDANVTVKVHFNSPKVVEYTVVFYNYDGSEISRRVYGYNEDLVPPDAPTKPCEEEGYEYVFSRWDPKVITKVTADAEYRPVFNKATKTAPESPYDSDRFWQNVFFPKILPIFLGVLLVLGGIVVGVVFLVKKGKKGRAPSGKEENN